MFFEGAIMRNILKSFYVLPMILLTGLAIGWPSSSRAQTPQQLWQAAYDGNLSTVKFCVEHGVAVDSVDKPGAQGRRGFTALVIASRNGHLDVVQYLVEHGANVNNANNGRQKSPLLAASWARHLDIVEYLLGKGANINAQAFNGFTPVNDAATIGDPVVVKYLVEHGADPRIKDRKGHTPLRNAEIKLGRYPNLRTPYPTRGSPEEFKQVIAYLQAHGG
jgi:ankyrin repeat protein